MSKAISENLQLHISVAFLLKAMAAVGVVVGSWYQIQIKFNELERTANELHQEVILLTGKMADIERKQKEDLEHHNLELIEENRSLMQRLGLKKR